MSKKAGLSWKAACLFETGGKVQSERTVFALEAALCAEGIRFPPGGVQRNTDSLPIGTLCRGARLYLGQTGRALGAAAGLSGSTISGFERNEPRVRTMNAERIAATLRQAGIRFTRNGFFLGDAA